MLFFIISAVVADNSTISPVIADLPDYYGDYYDNSSDVGFIDCTYVCNVHLYYQCDKTIEGKNLVFLLIEER